MKDVIVGFCPFCGGEGFICPAREQRSGRIFFICDECLNTFTSVEDLKAKRVQPVGSAYSELTLQQTVDAGLGQYALWFDGKKWVPYETLTESNTERLCQDGESDRNENMAIIQAYLSGLKMRSEVRNTILKNIEPHSDIAAEFACRISHGLAPSPCVRVCVGKDVFSAESLMQNEPRIKEWHTAYSYLAFLRDSPDCAVKMLKQGLPIK